MQNLHRLRTVIVNHGLHLHSTAQLRSVSSKLTSGQKSRTGEDDWNDPWETAWLPEEPNWKNRAPWEPDVTLPPPSTSESKDETSPDVDSKAFMDDKNPKWEKTKKTGKKQQKKMEKNNDEIVYNLENMTKDYRVRKQRVHAGLWAKEIEKMEEAKLGEFGPQEAGDDMDKVLDSCSEMFDSPTGDLNNAKGHSTSQLKNRPDGWETTTKAEDGSLWEMSQREEDILVQEFDRRIAYNKFQIESFVKNHIFSRRRPIDGWKYMIEVIGPNAKKGKGGV